MWELDGDNLIDRNGQIAPYNPVFNINVGDVINITNNDNF